MRRLHDRGLGALKASDSCFIAVSPTCRRQQTQKLIEEHSNFVHTAQRSQRSCLVAERRQTVRMLLSPSPRISQFAAVIAKHVMRPGEDTPI